MNRMEYKHKKFHNTKNQQMYQTCSTLECCKGKETQVENYPNNLYEVDEGGRESKLFVCGDVQ